MPRLKVEVDGVVVLSIFIDLVCYVLLKSLPLFVLLYLLGCASIFKLIDCLLQLRLELLARFLKVPEGVALGDHPDARHRQPDAHVEEKVWLNSDDGSRIY